MWKLVIEDDEGKRTVVPLTRDDYTVGRKEGNTIRLTERNVSRDHAKLSRRANGASNGAAERGNYALEDLTSYNGVYVNGLRVAHSQELQHGDLIQIGDYRIVLQDDAVADAPATAVPATDPKSTMPQGAAGGRASMLMERPNRFVMLAGPTPGAEYPLDTERMTVGRAEDASISINHNSVSRLHCEIHALGDGRFEIVDKGSSNGVRVNSSELRRGIIEAGDVIELGDVKFKFVGAGQIFRPGATDSQQLAAIGERTASHIVGKRKSSAVPIFVFLIVLAGGAGGAYYFTRPKPEPAPTASTQTTPPPETGEGQIMKEAQRLCATKDCITAHVKINEELSPDSPYRKAPEFKEIENKWALELIGKAEREGDVDKKRNWLAQVEKASTVDPAHRATAQTMLHDLDQATNPQNLPVEKKDGGSNALDAGVRALVDAGRRVVWDAAVAPTTSTTTTTSATTAPTGSVDTRDLALQNAEAAKRQLEGIVYGRNPDPEKVKLLRSLCRQLNDRNCVATCNAILAPKP